MTQISTSTSQPRRRTSRLSSSDAELSSSSFVVNTPTRSAADDSVSNVYDNSNSLPPSRIPVKSPARSSTSNLGGMAVAYSPPPKIRSNSMHHHSSPSSEVSSYAKKLIELKNAMEKLKTPPPISKGPSTYTPIRSSALTYTSPTNLRRSSFIEESSLSFSIENEIVMDISSSTDEENSLLNAYNDDNSHDSSISTLKSTQQQHTYSPRSSPFIPSDELKQRIESSKKVFQQSFEEQRLRKASSSLLNSLQDFDSSFSVCDPDLSMDSLKNTRNQLARIKKEVADIIESDSEDVNFVYKKTNNDETNVVSVVESNSLLLTILKFCLFFIITSILFTYLLINFKHFSQYAYADKLEEILNFVLQDN